jgi:predicted component of type VI protein secretion system
VKIVIEDEAGRRSTAPFTADEVAVGRATEGVAIRLTERNVSRRHARFFRQKGDVFVEDLGSLLGTRVNGDRIEGKRKLRPGDIVQIGDYDLAVLEEGVDLPALTPAPSPAATVPAEPTVALAPAEIRAIAASVAPAEPRPGPPSRGTAPPAPVHASRPPGARSSARAVMAAGAVALALGLAAGWAVGKYAFPPAPAAPSR